MDDHPDPVPGAGAANPRAELSEFLRTRRARLKPRDVGLPDFGRQRRVPGLRREELAQLAGVSVAYYTRLEQGDGRNVSAEVLDAIARALRLSDAEHAHLSHLAKPKDRKSAVRRQQVRGTVRTLLDAMDGIPAMIVGRRSDILAWNRPAAALFGDYAQLRPQERNWARLVFQRPEYRDLFVDWKQKAVDTVSQLRMDAGAHPNDPLLASLVGELSVKSEEFRQLWATHNVRQRPHGTQRLRHPLVGDLDLRLEAFVTDDPDQTLLTYHAEPLSPSAEGLRLLASWGTDATRAGMDGNRSGSVPSAAQRPPEIMILSVGGRSEGPRRWARTDPVSPIRTSPPPPDATELTAWVLDSFDELRLLRAGLIAALNEHTASQQDSLADIPDRVVLVATELATNAIKHGRPPTAVRLLRTQDQFVLDVADHDLSTVPELADTRPVDAGGRGLHLAQAFALTVGWYATDTTKHIWATFPITP